MTEADVSAAVAWFRENPDERIPWIGSPPMGLSGNAQRHAVAIVQAALTNRLRWTTDHASADALQLSEQARETGQCSQCGKGFAELACGPTHAVAAAVWFGGERQAQAAEALRRERDDLLARAASDEWRVVALTMTRVMADRTFAGDELAAAVREWIRPDVDVADVERVERAMNAWTVIRETS